MSFFDRPRPPHDRPHQDEIAAALGLLINMRKLTSVESLAAEAERMGAEGEAAARYFREQCVGLDARLALRKFDGEREEQRYLAFGAVLTASATKSVAVVPPVPPYVCDAFLALEGAAIVQLDEHHAPPFHQYRSNQRHFADGYAARQFARSAEVVVFDAYAGGDVLVRNCVADLLVTIAADVALYVHRRPHAHHADVPVPPEISARFIFV